MGEAGTGTQARPCPFCGEPFGGAPRCCPHCEEDLTGALGSAVAAAVVEATGADVEAGEFTPPPPRVFRPWRTGTMIAAGCLAAALAAGVAGFSRDTGSGTTAMLRMIGIFVGVPALVTAIVLGYQDLLMGDSGGTPDAGKAARRWTKALLQKRWRLAFHHTLPRGRSPSRPFALLDAVGLDGEDRDLSTERGFRDAWRPLLHGTTGTRRTSRFTEFSLEGDRGGCTGVSCVLTVRSRDPVVGLVGDSLSFPLMIRLLRVRGRWYVVDGAPCPEEPLED